MQGEPGNEASEDLHWTEMSLTVVPIYTDTFSMIIDMYQWSRMLLLLLHHDYIIAIVAFQVWRFPRVSGHAAASPHPSPRQHHQCDGRGAEHPTEHGSVSHEPAGGAEKPEDGAEARQTSSV